MVRLLLSILSLPLVPSSGFNPTMVRLLRQKSPFCFRRRQHWFQSHNGAIAATNIRQACYLKANVSIPQWCDCCPTGMTTGSTASSRFNPTMVRLLPCFLRNELNW